MSIGRRLWSCSTQPKNHFYDTEVCLLCAHSTHTTKRCDDTHRSNRDVCISKWNTVSSPRELEAYGSMQATRQRRVRNRAASRESCLAGQTPMEGKSERHGHARTDWQTDKPGERQACKERERPTRLLSSEHNIQNYKYRLKFKRSYQIILSFLNKHKSTNMKVLQMDCNFSVLVPSWLYE